jgi:hypothetical protein
MRVDVRSILRDEDLRRRLMVGVIRATQAREGIETSQEQAERAYDEVRRVCKKRRGVVSWA